MPELCLPEIDIQDADNNMHVPVRLSLDPAPSKQVRYLGSGSRGLLPVSAPGRDETCRLGQPGRWEADCRPPPSVQTREDRVVDYSLV